ncbi:MAG TPA: FKBP-type peptidyl-prolyl cis-trans isomerase [Acidimicrobiales bacterium]
MAIAAVVILGALFAWSTLAGDDGDDEDAASAEAQRFECDEPTGGAAPASDGPVADRDAPDPEPPPDDTPADAIECTTLIAGDGDRVAEGDTITVNYIGKTPDGEVFDSSFERGEPAEFAIGVGTVIDGWDEGLIGARVGERRRLVIGSENAYGAEGRPDGGIPPDSPLAFEIDIIDITEGGSAE